MKKTIGAVALVMLAMTGCTQGTEEPTPSPEPKKEQNAPEAEQADTDELAPNVTANEPGSDIPKWSKITSCEGTDEFGQYGYNVELTITNRADERMDFSAWIELLDENGDRVIDNLASSNGLEPGQSAQTSTPIMHLDEKDLPENLTCRVYEIEALPSE